MKKSIAILLVIVTLFAAVLNYLPHLNYSYPLHVDEWVHYQYSNHLSNSTPTYLGDNGLSLEAGFQFLLATLNSIGISYLFMFNFFPVILTILLCLSIFILTRIIFDEKSALFAVFFVAILQSSVAMLGPMFLVPMSVGLFLISIGVYIVETGSGLFFIPLSYLLIAHPPSALALALIINLRLIVKRKLIIKTIAFELLSVIIALPLYFDIIIKQGFGMVDNLSFVSIISPVFIPYLLGYVVSLIVVIGIHFSVSRKKYDLVVYSIAFLVLALIFYQLKTEVFIPYARALMYLFLVFAILFGYGCLSIINLFKNKKAQIIVAILLIVVILYSNLPGKIDSTNKVYHIINDTDFKAFNYIKDNTSKEVIILADPWISEAITPIAERQVYSRIPQGPDRLYEQKNQEIKTFFDSNCTNLALLKENNISVIYGNCNNPYLKEVYPEVYLVQ